MSKVQEKPTKGAKNKHQYLCGFNDSYNFILMKLKDYFYTKGYTKKDGKWTFTKYCILSKLYDYADEIFKDFQYTPEQLLGLIEYHGERREKFEKILKKLVSEKKARNDKIRSELNIDLGDVDNEDD